MVYKIADINILINPIYSYTKRLLEPYLTGSEEYEFDASADLSEVEKCRKRNAVPAPAELCEGSVIYTKICKKMLEYYDGFFFHSSSLSVDGEGYLFTAQSGTGKSTHTALWRRVFGGKVVMINDDKPLVRKIDGRFYVFGTPWMGKSCIGTNAKAPVKAIYVLSRGEENRVERVSPSKVFKELLEATLLPEGRENMGKLLGLYDELFSSAMLFKLVCRPDEDAARLAFDAANKY